MQQVHRPVIVSLPAFECGAPATLESGAPAWPKLGHDRHAYLEVVSAGCGGRLSAAGRVLGRVKGGARFDFADELRSAKPPGLRFEPGEAGYAEVWLRFVISPRVHFHSLRVEGRWVRFVARNTLDNTTDLRLTVEIEGTAVDRADNLPPNMERDYEFTLPRDLQYKAEIRVTLDKAPDALEGGYQFQDQVYASK